ncbi:MAG: sulfite oxidase heme-binding subunit YedZ [Gammaproteobacteria bacterium]
MPPARLSPRRFTLFKSALFALCLVPAFAAAFAVFSDSPPPDPADYLTFQSGEQTLRFLVITLAMTPLRLLTGWHSPLKLRRMFGLFAFFYAACHFSVYLFLDLALNWAHVWEDIVERKFITVGFAALLLLIPLAATSNAFSIKRLGAKAWTNLHRAVYPICILGAVHFLWIKRAKDIGEPLAYLAIMCALLAMRLPAAQHWIKRRRA